MNKTGVLNYNTLEFTKILFEKPSKQKGGFYTSFIKYQQNDDKIPIVVQTPKLKLASDPIINDSRSYLDIIVDKDTPGFYEFISNLDDFNIQTAFKKSEEWFSNQFEIEVIDDFYTSQVKFSKKIQKPVIRFKLPSSKGQILTNVYNADKETIQIKDLKEGNTIVLLLELNGMRFLKQQFLCDWHVHQIKKYDQVKVTLNNNCLIDDVDDVDCELGPYNDEIIEPIDEVKFNELVNKSLEKEKQIQKIENKREKKIDEYNKSLEKINELKNLAESEKERMKINKDKLDLLDQGIFSDSEEEDLEEEVNEIEHIKEEGKLNSDEVCDQRDIEENSRILNNENKANSEVDNELEHNDLESDEVESNEAVSDEVESNEAVSDEVESNELESNDIKFINPKDKEMEKYLEGINFDSDCDSESEDFDIVVEDDISENLHISEI